MDQLMEIVTEVSANTNTVIRETIRTRASALGWLEKHWNIGKGIVRLWFEHQIEVEKERKKGNRDLEKMYTEIRAGKLQCSMKALEQLETGPYKPVGWARQSSTRKLL